jgi:hypothetical protein
MCDEEHGCIHLAIVFPLDLDKDCPLDDVHVAINNNLFYNKKS